MVIQVIRVITGGILVFMGAGEFAVAILVCQVWSQLGDNGFNFAQLQQVNLLDLSVRWRFNLLAKEMI